MATVNIYDFTDAWGASGTVFHNDSIDTSSDGAAGGNASYADGSTLIRRRLRLGGTFVDKFKVAMTGAVSILSVGAACLDANSALSSSYGSAFKATGTWITGGSATTTKPHILIEPTGATSTGWSTAGTALGINASASYAGVFLSAQTNGVQRFSVDSVDGTASISRRMAASTGSGLIESLGIFGAAPASQATYRVAGRGIMALYSSNATYESVMAIGTGGFSWSAGANYAPDLLLSRDAANILAQRNGTNAQTSRIYNTYTDSTIGEWFSAAWDANVLQLTTRANGTGSARALSFGVGSAGQWQVNTSGHMVPTTTNTYDIGASGTIVRRMYASSADIQTLRTTNINNGNDTHTVWTFPNGTDNVTYAPGGTAPLMRWCGTTASFPALKRSSTDIQVRLADDSGYAGLQLGAASSSLKVGTHSAIAAETVTGYITIKDSAGTDRKVAVVS